MELRLKSSTVPVTVQENIVHGEGIGDNRDQIPEMGGRAADSVQQQNSAAAAGQIPDVFPVIHGAPPFYLS